MQVITFDEFWRRLINVLRNEQTIRNWTINSDYLGRGDFPAIYQGGDYIECRPPNAMNPQIVPRRDFEFMYDNWNDYVNGRIRRPQLRDRSRFTKYTISIIHQYENLMQRAR